MRAKKIVVLGTGGTIAGRAGSAQDNVGYQAAVVGVHDLLHALPLPDCEFEVEQVAQVDSKDMDFVIWSLLAQRCAHWIGQPGVAGIVITHGTDTLEETAFFLQSVLAPGKPVVLTGAMRPATSLAADGPGNLADAIALAASDEARGVCVGFAGAVHAACDVMKMHGHRMDAFGSGEGGPLAYVEEGQVRRLRPWPEGAALREAAHLPPPAAWPRVEIVVSHAGATGSTVRALAADGVRGIVVAATGNGTLHHSLQEALLEAQRAGVAVRRATRCPLGGLMPHAGDVLPASTLSPVKARIALMLELMH